MFLNSLDTLLLYQAPLQGGDHNKKPPLVPYPYQFPFSLQTSYSPSSSLPLYIQEVAIYTIAVPGIGLHS